MAPACQNKELQCTGNSHPGAALAPNLATNVANSASLVESLWVCGLSFLAALAKLPSPLGAGRHHLDRGDWSGQVGANCIQIPRKAHLSVKTLIYLKMPFNTSQETPKSSLFKIRATATFSSHAAFRSSRLPVRHEGQNWCPISHWSRRLLLGVQDQTPGSPQVAHLVSRKDPLNSVSRNTLAAYSSYSSAAHDTQRRCCSSR